MLAGGSVTASVGEAGGTATPGPGVNVVEPGAGAADGIGPGKVVEGGKPPGAAAGAPAGAKVEGTDAPAGGGAIAGDAGMAPPVASPGN